MKGFGKDSEILSDLKSSAFKLLGTISGSAAFESFVKKNETVPVKTKGSEFADFGALSFKKPIDQIKIDLPPPIKTEKTEDEFLDFSFKQARNPNSFQLSNNNVNIIEKPAIQNPISVSAKLLSLKNENIQNAQESLRVDGNYYLDQLKRNFADPNKDIVEKLHDFCDIADSLNRSSKGFISELKAEKVGIEETIRIKNEVGNIIDTNFTELVKSEPIKSKIRLKMS